MAESPATFLTLAEEGGITLELRDRALPYRPISITGTQRAEFTWYPGSPHATVQMLGPEEGVINLQGYWKDRFILGKNAVSVEQPQAEEVALLNPATSSVSVADLVTVVDRMRRSGRTVKFTWDGIVRYGHITSFTQTWHNVHDCEWELEFSVISQTELQVAALTAQAVVPADIAISQTTSAAAMAELAANKPAAAGPPSASLALRPAPLNLPDWLRGDKWRAGLESLGWVQATAEWLQWGATSYANIATQITSVVEFVPNVVRDTVGVASGIVSQVSRATGNTIDSSITEYFAVTTALGVNSQDQVPFGIQLGAKNYTTNVNNIVRSVRTNNAVARYAYTREMQGDVNNVFVAPANMDLRDVSTRFYSTPDNWSALMLYNELPSSRLEAGQEIKIPAKPNNGVVGSTGGGASR